MSMKRKKIYNRLSYSKKLKKFHKESLKSYNYLYSLYYPIYVIFKNICQSVKFYCYIKSIQKIKVKTIGKKTNSTFFKERLYGPKNEKGNTFINWLQLEWSRLYLGLSQWNINLDINWLNSHYIFQYILKGVFFKWNNTLKKFNILKYYYLYLYKKLYLNVPYLILSRKNERERIRTVVNYKKIRANEVLYKTMVKFKKKVINYNFFKGGNKKKRKNRRYKRFK